jgi:predicted porin
MTKTSNMSARFACASPVAPTVLRCIAAATALCCAGLVQAQTAAPSTVTLYGLADVGITQVSGLKAGSVTQVASGIMEGSRWGMKGNEDLGGGYRAVFTLESRVELDNGSNSNRPISGSQLSDRFSQAPLMGLTSPSPVVRGIYQAAVTGVGALLANEFGVNVGASGNRLFDRQAFVGLVTPFGAVLAGRQYTPAYETFGTYDIMATQSALSAGQIVQFPAVFEIRNSNALAYRIQQGGISGSLMYAPGEVAGDSSKTRLFGLNANYKTDDFSVGFGYNTKNNELGQKSLTSTVLGASMNFGSSTVSTLVSKMTDDNPAGLSIIASSLVAGSPSVPEPYATAVQNAFINAFKQDGTLFHIGYRYVTGPSTISVAYNRYNDNRPADADVASFGVAYTYALSKRTDLNGVLVRFDNKNLAQVAPGGNGYLGGVTASAGTDSTGLAIGIRHRF